VVGELLASGIGEIRRVYVILAGNANECEEGVAPGVGQSRTHPVRTFGLGDRADRPIGGDPFTRSMRQGGRQIDVIRPSRCTIAPALRNTLRSGSVGWGGSSHISKNTDSCSIS